MLVYGTANPEGYKASEGTTVYLTEQDLQQMTPTMRDVPVKIEHTGYFLARPIRISNSYAFLTGNPIGKVISAWRNSARNGSMDLVIEIDEKLLQGAFASEFVKRKICRDFSLGYSMQMSANSDGRVVTGGKRVLEVSIVKKGARDGCKIRRW